MTPAQARTIVPSKPEVASCNKSINILANRPWIPYN
jgi:hypothetical protein